MKTTPRESFITGPDEKLRKHDPNVAPNTHTQEVLADLAIFIPKG